MQLSFLMLATSYFSKYSEWFQCESELVKLIIAAQKLSLLKNFCIKKALGMNTNLAYNFRQKNMGHKALCIPL